MGQFLKKRPNFLIFFTYFFEADSNFASQTSIISTRFTHGKRQNGGFQEAEPQKDFAYTVKGFRKKIALVGNVFIGVSVLACEKSERFISALFRLLFVLKPHRFTVVFMEIFNDKSEL
jgi:hypothetical protein